MSMLPFNNTENSSTVLYLNELEDFIKKHRAIHHPLFTYLKKCSETGFTKKQYQLFRDNFFFRTIHTIPSVCLLLRAAALNFDFETLTTAGQNVFEETGCGNSKKSHSKLLEVSYNFHGDRVFKINPIKLRNVFNSSCIIKEAIDFVREEKKLYESDIYAVVLGASFAHETAAVPMLTNFYESIFLCYKNFYTLEEFNYLSEYFLIHISGLEQRHAEDSQNAVGRLSYDLANLEYIKKGAAKFLEYQEFLWEGLHREMVLAENGTKVLVNQETEKRDR